MIHSRGSYMIDNEKREQRERDKDRVRRRVQVTIDEDNDKIKEEPQDKNELLAEKENNDSKLDTGISSNVQENKNNSLVFFIITIIILIIGGYISFRVYKNKKIE